MIYLIQPVRLRTAFSSAVLPDCYIPKPLDTARKRAG